MRKYLIGISAAAIIAVAAGCGGGEDTSGSDTGQQSSQPASGASAQGAHNDQDIAFAQMMIPHHQQAIDMAKLAGKRATDPAVKDLAARIEGAQDPEIKQLTAMLDRWGAPTAPSSESSMPGMAHGDMSGEGMMTAEEMRGLEGAADGKFDRRWLEMMIKHHEGAVTMARTELELGSDAEAKKLAKRIVDAQEAEIGEMTKMLG